jgi:hypothetical protein
MTNEGIYVPKYLCNIVYEYTNKLGKSENVDRINEILRIILQTR